MINKLVNSRLFKDYVIKDYNVLGVYLGGSRLVGTDGETSDYDLAVIYDEPYNIPNESFVQINYKDTHIHWYYINIREFISDKDCSLATLGKLYTFYLDAKFIYKEFNLEWLKNYRDCYLKIATYKFYTVKLKRYKEDLSTLHNIQYTKLIYYGEVLYSLMTNNLDIAYLKEIKKDVRNKTLSEEQIITINSHLKYIRDYVEELKNNEFNLNEEVNRLNKEIYEEYSRIKL